MVNVLITRHQAIQIAGGEQLLNELLRQACEGGTRELALLKSGAKLARYGKASKRPNVFQLSGYTQDGRDVFDIILELVAGKRNFLVA